MACEPKPCPIATGIQRKSVVQDAASLGSQLCPARPPTNGAPPSAPSARSQSGRQRKQYRRPDATSGGGCAIAGAACEAVRRLCAAPVAAGRARSARRATGGSRAAWGCDRQRSCLPAIPARLSRAALPSARSVARGRAGGSTLDDFRFIIGHARYRSGIAVAGDSPFQSMADLIDAGRGGRELNYAATDALGAITMSASARRPGPGSSGSATSPARKPRRPSWAASSIC